MSKYTEMQDEELDKLAAEMMGFRKERIHPSPRMDLSAEENARFNWVSMALSLRISSEDWRTIVEAVLEAWEKINP